MIVLFSICDTHWSLPWILPALLGFGLGWWLWARYKREALALRQQARSFKANISQLESDLKQCKKLRVDLEGDLAVTKGQMRELQREIKIIKKGTHGVGYQAFEAANIKQKDTDMTPPIDPHDKDAALPYSEGKPSGDNLVLIEGIGKKLAKMLADEGVDTFEKVLNIEESLLKKLLGKHMATVNLRHLRRQALLANEGSWDELFAYQKKIDNNPNGGSSKAERMLRHKD